MNKKEADAFCWALRQMRDLGFLSMRQSNLVYRMWLKSKGRMKRFTDEEVEFYCGEDLHKQDRKTKVIWQNSIDAFHVKIPNKNPIQFDVTVEKAEELGLRLLKAVREKKNEKL